MSSAKVWLDLRIADEVSSFRINVADEDEDGKHNRCNEDLSCARELPGQLSENHSKWNQVPSAGPSTRKTAVTAGRRRSLGAKPWSCNTGAAEPDAAAGGATNNAEEEVKKSNKFDPQAVLDWLIELDDGPDAKWILENWSAKRPHLHHSTVFPQGVSSLKMNGNETSAEVQNSELQTTPDPSADNSELKKSHEVTSLKGNKNESLLEVQNSELQNMPVQSKFNFGMKRLLEVTPSKENQGLSPTETQNSEAQNPHSGQHHSDFEPQTSFGVVSQQGKERVSVAAAPSAATTGQVKSMCNTLFSAVKPDLPSATSGKWSKLQNLRVPVVPGVTTVQFSTFMYFCEDSDSELIVDVMRIGDLSSPTKVQYATRDGSATAGAKYVATMGTLIFEANESEKQIQVLLIKDGRWSTTTEFGLTLKQEGLENGILGRYLWQTRVKVLNNDTFPSNRYKERIIDNDLDKIDKTGLFIEYFKFNWQNVIVRRGTIKMMMVDQLHNLYFLQKLFMKVILLDFIFKGVVEDQQFCLTLYMLCLVVPFALLHYFDQLQLSWKVGGTSRAALQRALLEKFLNYSDESRSGLNQGELILGMTRHSAELVHDGYMQVLSFVRCVGQLLAILLFQLMSPYLVGDGTQHPREYLPLLIYPVLLLTFLFVRNGKTRAVVRAEQVGQEKLVAHIDSCVTTYQLIAEYNKRPFFVEMFAEKIKNYNASVTKAASVLQNNGAFAEWITVIYVAFYTQAGGMEYINGDLTLGLLLTNLSILGAIGKASGQIYGSLMILQRNVPSLERVVTYMNLQTDVKHRKILNRKRRAMTQDLSHKAASRSMVLGIPCDCLRISIQDFKFAYRDRRDTDFPASLRVDEMEILQGSLSLLVGPRGQWKSTILKILGGVILPPVQDDKLGFFVPSHLRVLHVPTEPMFFPGTMKKNLLFGVSPGDPDGEEGRIEKICVALGLPDHVFRFVRTDEILDWGSVLSQTQRQILSLARALIANPEVLCIHKPTMPFDEEGSKRVFQVLRDYVDNKGVYQDAATKDFRRPRTCMITSNKMLSLEVADRTFHVSDVGIKCLTKGTVTESMMLGDMSK